MSCRTLSISAWVAGCKTASLPEKTICDYRLMEFASGVIMMDETNVIKQNVFPLEVIIYSAIYQCISMLINYIVQQRSY